ncbi:hypothetical protein QTO34_008913 [Cnephaeus nilssonii]|uniref:Plexin domain-containing protein 1 n=1 Tax=Cnephaeus nilssonii TaxID=3371016 RepID=A0AA40HGT6_CNENI|nr:hypothetical protein QTO34_008913 [Eptesicus nilssonii]
MHYGSRAQQLGRHGGTQERGTSRVLTPGAARPLHRVVKPADNTKLSQGQLLSAVSPQHQHHDPSLKGLLLALSSTPYSLLPPTRLLNPGEGPFLNTTVVELDPSKVTSTSAVEFTPLPTCLQHRSCDACMSSDLTFNCSWCHVLQRCSSGFDRYRQEWLAYGCAQEAEGRTCEDFQDEGHYSSSPGSSVSPSDGDHSTTSSSLSLDSLTTEGNVGGGGREALGKGDCPGVSPSLTGIISGNKNCPVLSQMRGLRLRDPHWGHLLDFGEEPQEGSAAGTHLASSRVGLNLPEVPSRPRVTKAVMIPLISRLLSFLLEDDTKLNPYAGGDGLQDNLSPKTKGPPVHLGTIVGIVLAVLVVAAIILAGVYISGHPTSNAALFFIERRPHHWPAMRFRNHPNHSTYTEVEPAGHEKEGFVEAEQC